MNNVAIFRVVVMMFMSLSLSCLSVSGAVRLQTPLLLPRNRRLYEGCETACFMDHSGMLVSLPYDLRVR